MVLERLFSKSLRIPRHLAVTMEGLSAWQARSRAADPWQRRNSVVLELLRAQVRFNIPLVSISLLPEGRNEPGELDALAALFRALKGHSIVHKNRMKLSLLGKWYELPQELVDDIKQLIDETKGHDRFFMNLCVNYDGQEEILSACRLIARKILAGKLDVDSVNRELVKENLYSSYLLAPDLIVKTGARRRVPSLFLWDSPGAILHFTGKSFNDLRASDIMAAIREYSLPKEERY